MGRHYRAEDPAPGQPDPLRSERPETGSSTGGSPDDWFRDTTTPPAAYRSTPGYAPAPDDVLSTSPAMHPVGPDRTRAEDAAERTTRLDPVPADSPPADGPVPTGDESGRRDHAAHTATGARPDAPLPHPAPADAGPPSRPHADRPRVHDAGHSTSETPPGATGPAAGATSDSATSGTTAPGTGRDAATASSGGGRRATATGRHSTVSATGSRRAVTTTGRHGTVTSTGSHRAVDKKPQRKIAAWPVAGGVLVVLVVAGIFGWNWASGALSSRAEAQAAACQEGRSTLRVATAPAVAEPVRQAAKTWNDDDTVVHGHCITVTVQPAAPSEVFDDLTGDRTRGTPGAWITDGPQWPDRLASAQPDRIGASPEQLTTGPDGEFTYLSLAGDGVDTVQQRAAQSFRAHLTSQSQQHFAQAGVTG